MTTLNTSKTLACSELQVVHCGDCREVKSRHPHIGDLVSEQDLSTYATFSGACDEFPLFFYFLDRSDRPCAYFRVIPDQAVVDDHRIPWAWTGDNFTVPKYRGQGLSTKLQAAATKYLHERGIARGSVFSTEVTLHIFKKIGIPLVGHVPRFVALRSVHPLLDAHLSNRAIKRALAVAGHLAVKAVELWAATYARRWRHGTCWVAADELDDSDLQQLLDNTKGSHDGHFSTDLCMMRKKLALAARAGDVKWDVLCDSGSSQPIAYAILRQRLQSKPLAEKYSNFSLMTLLDFGIAKSDARGAAAVLGHLVHQFLNSQADVLEIISADAQLNRLARRCGLIPAGKGMSFSSAFPEKHFAARGPMSVHQWPLTHFCGDAFTL